MIAEGADGIEMLEAARLGNEIRGLSLQGASG